MYHLICYTLPSQSTPLTPPSIHSLFSSMTVADDLLYGQGFRRPLDVNQSQEDESSEFEEETWLPSALTHQSTSSQNGLVDYHSVFDPLSLTFTKSSLTQEPPQWIAPGPISNTNSSFNLSDSLE